MQQNKQISAPVIFFPGTQCDERIWMPLWQQLNMQQRSYVPLQWADSIEHMLALSDDRILSFEGKAHLIGYSMGGYIAALTALRHAEKVESLTLICYNPAGLSKDEMSQRKMLVKNIDSNKLSYFKNTNLKLRMARYLTKDEISSDDAVDILGEMESDLGITVLRSHILSTTPRKNLCESLLNSKFPIHFICAEHDQIATPENINSIAKRISNASYTELAGTAHMVTLTRPTELAQILSAKLD